MTGRVFVVLMLAGACTSSEVERREPAPMPDPDKTPIQDELVRELSLAYPAAAPASSRTRSFELTAAPTQVPQFDGRLLDVWAFNGQVPGPVLRVRLGEEVEVRFRNGLPRATTIHWHGVRVPNAMDGVPGVTQDPIPPGGSFTYRFVPKDAGTFWFHPHVQGAEQVERGLYGVLVVDDREPLPYSRDEVWVLDDWRLGRDGQIDPRFVTRHDLAHDGRWGQIVTVNGDAAQQMTVRPGERIRLRLVNTSNARVYRPEFGELPARVIAIDGMYAARPLSPEGFELAPGNRMDLDIQIPNTDEREYSIVERFSRRPFTLATVIVSGDAVRTPDFDPPSNPQVPRWVAASARPVDVTYALDARRGGRTWHSMDHQRSRVGRTSDHRARRWSLDENSISQRFGAAAPDAHSRAVFQSHLPKRSRGRRTLLSRHGVAPGPRDHRHRNGAARLGALDDALPHLGTRRGRHDDCDRRRR